MSLKTSSRGQRKPTFPLLRLPYELLDTIFEFAYEEDDRPEPVCRALRPFSEKRFYRNVKVVDYSSLAAFCSTANTSNRLAQLVRLLDLDFAACEDENVRTAPTAPGRTRRLVSVKSFTKMLSRLQKLKSLRVAEVDADLCQVLSSTRLDSSLPELEVLDLALFRARVVDEGVWAKRLSSLREIRLRASIGRIPLPQTVSPMQADTLVLSGDSNINPWPGYELRAAFPSLRMFEAYDLMDESQYLSIVHGLPRNLNKLRLEHSDSDGVYRAGSLDSVLPEFKDLESLYLCAGTFTLPAISSYLDAANNLVTLGFGIDAPVTDDFLLSLVKGPTRLQHLRTLVLDYVTCGRGLTMESQGYELGEDAADTDYHTYPGWWEPVWPDDCSEWGSHEVISAAEDADIELEGSALAAENWEEDYGGEVCDALLIWGLDVDDFKEARAVLGNRAVEDFRSAFKN